jgi:hypothetical protein
MFFLYLNSGIFLSFIYGSSTINDNVINLFYILIIYPILYGFVHIYSTQIFLISNNYMIYKKILFSAFIFNILIGLSLISQYDIYGIAYTMILTELFILLLSLIEYIRKISL